MIRGLYTAAAGMLSETTRMDVTANNLANVNTAGYKKDTAVNIEFPEMLLWRINDYTKSNPLPVPIGMIGTGAQVDEIATIYTPGALHPTGNTFDLAIVGDGFFAIDTPQGIRYTRNGTFTLNAKGELVTQDGYHVRGEGGIIAIPDTNSGRKVTISEEGNIYLDDTMIGTLAIYRFADKSQLRKEGESRYAAAAGVQPQPATNVAVQQGFLEISNVNAVSEMVNLIAVYRAYEANQKVVHAHDDMLGKAVNEVGKV